MATTPLSPPRRASPVELATPNCGVNATNSCVSAGASALHPLPATGRTGVHTRIVVVFGGLL